MEELALEAGSRPVIGKQVKVLRREGKIPAVIYGRHIPPTAIVLDSREASRLLNQLGPSSLVTIIVGDEKHVTLVREKQRNVLTGDIIHIDFQAVSLLEKIRTSVSIEYVGESPAVEEFDAILNQEMTQIQVESLPNDLPESFVVDLSVLKEIGDMIYLKDIPVPEGVEILEDPESLVAVVSAQAAEEEEEELEEVEEALDEPEVIEKGKQEEDEDF